MTASKHGFGTFDIPIFFDCDCNYSVCHVGQRMKLLN